MIQACDNVELRCAPPTSDNAASTDIPATATTTTSTVNDFTNETDTSGGGQTSNGRKRHSSASRDASSPGSETQYPPDVKPGFDELCPVCGDKVSGYHYGLLTCESCKGFFKRTVQNKKVYSCVDSRSCHIDKSQRKRCPYCRFQKCLNVGMKLEAVRQDRMRGGRNKFGPMYKRDRALKQQAIRQQQRIMAECEMNLGGAVGGPGSPVDIKPDPAVLQASMGLGFNPSAMGTGPLPNPSDISAMAAAMAAAAASAVDGNSVTTVGNSYVSMGHLATTAGGGVHGGHGGGHGSASGGSSSPNLYLEDNATGALNLHNHHIHSQQHNSNNIHHGQTHTRNGHHHHQQQQQQQHHHHHTQPLQIPDSYLVSPSASSFPSVQDVSENSTSPVDSMRSYGLPPPLVAPTLPSLLCEIKANLLDEDEMKHKMMSFLTDTLRQMDSTNGSEHLLPIVCRMVDQLLFLMVEWARNSPFFREMKVEDQMKLLQHSWSEILILDFVYRQVHEYWGTELVLPNGPRLNFDVLDKLGLGDVRARLFELIKKSRELKLDYHEYMCLKFLILLNPDISGLENRLYVEQSQEKVNAALLEYCFSFYPNMKDKFGQILLRLPEIRIISIRVEEFLYFKHINNQVPDQTLLTEMLHSRRK